MNPPPKAEWDAFLDEILRPKPPAPFYEWFVSPTIDREIEACGSIEKWFSLPAKVRARKAKRAKRRQQDGNKTGATE